MMRRGRPGLLGMAARTAVVAGTATATAGAVSRHSAKKQQAAQQEAYAEQQSAQQQADMAQQLQSQQAEIERLKQQQEPEPAAAPAAGGGALTDDAINQLKQLADLKSSGVLSDAEFEAAKAKILGI